MITPMIKVSRLCVSWSWHVEHVWTGDYETNVWGNRQGRQLSFHCFCQQGKFLPCFLILNGLWEFSLPHPLLLWPLDAMEGLLFPCPTLIANSLSEVSVFIHLHISSQTLIKLLCISLVWPWVWQAALEAGVKSSYGLDKRVEAIEHVRKISKLDMKLNSAMPMIEVDPETYHVTADGVPLVCQPAESLPLTQNYFLF